MRKTKDLLLAGTIIPALIASGMGPGFAATAPGSIVIAQAEPGGPNGEERKHPGQPGAPAHPPEGQRPGAPPHAAEPAAPRQAAPEAPRPAAPHPAEAPAHQAPPAEAPRQPAPEREQPRPAPKAAPAPHAEEAPAARQPAPRAEPEAVPQRAAPKAAAPEPAPQHVAPKAAEPRPAEPEAAPQRVAPKAAAPEQAPDQAQPGHAAPGVKAATPPHAEPGAPAAAPEAPAHAGVPKAGEPRPAVAPEAVPPGQPANNHPAGAPAHNELRRDAAPGEPTAPNAVPGQPAPNHAVPGQPEAPAAAQPQAAPPAAHTAPAAAQPIAPAQPGAAPAQGNARPAAAPPAPPPPPPPPPAAPPAPQGAAPQGAVPGQQGQRRDRGNNNGAIVGAAAGFVGGFLAAQAVENFNQVRADRQVFTDDGVNIIREPGRTIVEQDDTYYIAHDENERFRELGYDLNVRQADGYEVASYVARDGSSIYTYTDAQGRLIRRVREYPDGRNIILIDNRYTRYDRNFVDDVVTLPPPPPADFPPPDRYIVNAAEAPPALVYDTLAAPPVAPLPRRYTLDQIRYSPDIRARMRSVDLNTITFASGSWTVSPDQAQKLASIAGAINAAIRQDPKEIYMVEGYTDATGNPTDNLSLSDRRAQSVATILTRDFQVPPENLVTQGYGQQYLKVQTQGPSVENRRVAVRRITPLLGQGTGAQ